MLVDRMAGMAFPCVCVFLFWVAYSVVVLSEYRSWRFLPSSGGMSFPVQLRSVRWHLASRFGMLRYIMVIYFSILHFFSFVWLRALFRLSFASSFRRSRERRLPGV